MFSSPLVWIRQAVARAILAGSYDALCLLEGKQDDMKSNSQAAENLLRRLADRNLTGPPLPLFPSDPPDPEGPDKDGAAVPQGSPGQDALERLANRSQHDQGHNQAPPRRGPGRPPKA